MRYIPAAYRSFLLTRGPSQHGQNFCYSLTKGTDWLGLFKLSDKALDRVSNQDIVSILSKFLGYNIQPLLTAKQLCTRGMFWPAFCFGCQAAFASAASMKLHVETTCLAYRSGGAGTESAARLEKPFFCAPCKARFGQAELAKHLEHFDSR
jgi:hypothetical protein